MAEVPFNPLTPSLPISYPLKTLEELESRSFFNSFHFPFNRSTVNLPGEKLPNRQRVLVCHDMKGGYTDDDKWVQGGTNSGAYGIWHWYLIDVFVYFSHTLVTLPPPSWTNTAHKHGVKVLGTFIMEFDEGKLLADKLLASKASIQMYVARLTELSVALGFDGWLINMEVELDSGQIPNLIEFISRLTETMHSSLPGSLVIWYDSVTTDGKLEWQDQLNDKNKPFFDRCDGIFVDYTWKENYPKLSANVAGDRKFDVYMGIDVFGRGTYGDGQWTTNVALDVIKRDEVSAAIFAPGWVYETNQPPDFQTAQNRWWRLVEKSWGIVQKYPKLLPFYSNFDQGHGYHVSVDGIQISDSHWNNLSSQSFQPFIEYPVDSTNPIQVYINVDEDSYNGGGNITFCGTLDNGTEFRARLFQGELFLGNAPVHFKFSVQLSENSLLGLAVELSSTKQEKKSVFLAASGDTLLAMNQFSRRFTNVIMPRHVTGIKENSEWVIQESSIEMDGHTLKEIHAICYRSKKSRAVTEYYAVLGDIKIYTTAENSHFPPSTSWLVDAEFVSWSSGSERSKRVSVKINWKLKNSESDTFPKYNIYVNMLKKSSGNQSEVVEGNVDYLGVAFVKAFYVSELEVPYGVSGLEFVVQVCGVDGDCQNLELAPFYLLLVQS